MFLQRPEQEKSMIWRFRYWITKNCPLAFVKVMLSFDYQHEKQRTAALNFIEKWKTKELELILPLVSALFSQNPIYSSDSVLPSANEQCRKDFGKIRAAAVRELKSVKLQNVIFVLP